MGLWHLLTHMPSTSAERHAANCTDRYELIGTPGTTTTTDTNTGTGTTGTPFTVRISSVCGHVDSTHRHISYATWSMLASVSNPQNTLWAVDLLLLGLRLPLKQPLHLLEVEPDYYWCLLGTPDRKGLWILTRQVPTAQWGVGVAEAYEGGLTLLDFEAAAEAAEAAGAAIRDSPAMVRREVDRALEWAQASSPERGWNRAEGGGLGAGARPLPPPPPPRVGGLDGAGCAAVVRGDGSRERAGVGAVQTALTHTCAAEINKMVPARWSTKQEQAHAQALAQEQARAQVQCGGLTLTPLSASILENPEDVREVLVPPNTPEVTGSHASTPPHATPPTAAAKDFSQLRNKEVEVLEVCTLPYPLFLTPLILYPLTHYPLPPLSPIESSVQRSNARLPPR
ncbi:hypothetical protein B484DRAFT_197120 [Ochromonadaceae sp. CCMP2298]|nr:hypothetical protein B484DRAFT_197120 [Ochromonadaceae sp. CCMP2298]